jgi:hypothetical protein
MDDEAVEMKMAKKKKATTRLQAYSPRLGATVQTALLQLSHYFCAWWLLWWQQMLLSLLQARTQQLQLRGIESPLLLPMKKMMMRVVLLEKIDRYGIWPPYRHQHHRLSKRTLMMRKEAW